MGKIYITETFKCLIKITKHQILEIYEVETYWLCQNDSSLVHKRTACCSQEEERKQTKRSVVSESMHINHYPLIYSAF